MEKFIFAFSSVLIFNVLVSLSSVYAHEHRGPPAMQECKTQEQATDEDLKNLRNPEQPKNKAMKCVITCLGEKSGKIVNNKLNPEAFTNAIKSSPNYTEQLQASVNEMIEECKNVNDPDRCESGAKIMGCMKDGAVKRGIQREFFRGMKP